MSAILLLLIPIALFVLLIRPQRQRISAQRALLSALAPGDEVMTSGGIIGTIVTVGDREASVEVAPGTVIRVALPAIVGRPAAPPAEPTTREEAE